MRVFIQQGDESSLLNVKSPQDFFKTCRDDMDTIGLSSEGELIIWRDNLQRKKFQHVHAAINNRARVINLIKKYVLSEGRVWMQFHGWDLVDHVRWSDKPELVEVGLAFKRMLYDKGCGECQHNWELLEPTAHETRKASECDYIMQAFEDGHPHTVYYGD